MGDLKEHFRHFRGLHLVEQAMAAAGVELPPVDRRLSRSGARRPLTRQQTILVLRWCYRILGQKLERYPQELAHYLGQVGAGISGEKPARFRQPPKRAKKPEAQESLSASSDEDETQ